MTKTIFITGTSSGLGKLTALQLVDIAIRMSVGRDDKIARHIRRRLCALETSDVIETAGRLLADILELAPALPTRSSRGAK
jgi:NADP-dependent 3-hydroxy acid dehydrogenase YdfG